MPPMRSPTMTTSEMTLPKTPAPLDEGVEEATPSGPERACDSHKHVGHE